MSKVLSLKEALARRGEPAAVGRDPSGTLIRLRLRMNGDVDRPVDLARLLIDAGVTLRRAHALLDRMAAGESVVISAAAGDRDERIARFAALGIEAREMRIPEVSSRAVRTRLKLSQADFALKFGFELDTVQNWDQGRNQPDPAAKVLLAIIDRDPALVEAVLTEQEDGAR
ncbi:helix-turn-helix domain-containing protein [Methylobacterium sp. A54F]